MWHLLDQLDWGNVPTWIAGSVASGSLFVSARTARQERRRRLLDQAAKVHVLRKQSTAESDGWRKVNITVVNASECPISDVWVWLTGEIVNEPAGDVLDFLDAGDRWQLEVRFREKVNPGPIASHRVLVGSVVFTDGSGYRWQRWSTGGIYPPINGCPSTGWRRPLTYVLPKRLVSAWRRRPSRPPMRQPDYPGSGRR